MEIQQKFVFVCHLNFKPPFARCESVLCAVRIFKLPASDQCAAGALRFLSDFNLRTIFLKKKNPIGLTAFAGARRQLFIVTQLLTFHLLTFEHRSFEISGNNFRCLVILSLPVDDRSPSSARD
jgi:hypothetical protein